MPKKTNKIKNPLKKWYIKRRSKLDPITIDDDKYFINILSNSLYRIILSILSGIGIFLLIYVLGLSLNQSNNWVITLFSSAFFIVMVFFPAKYIWSNFKQLDYEMGVSNQISILKWRIKSLSKPSPKKNYRSFQANMTVLRNYLVGFLENSEIVSPPISNFELNRLKTRIDIFSNVASEVLVPSNKLFSLEEEFDAHYGYDMSTEEQDDIDEIEANREMTGQFLKFDLRAMDEFLDHLWDVLFDKEAKRYSPLSYKHPVNLILLSRFFDKWNSKIAVCYNCEAVLEKAKKDIEEYYKSVGELESERRQRRWKLRDDAIIVIVSVSLSTLIQYLISIT